MASQVVEVRKDLPSLKVIWIHGDQLLMAPYYVRRISETSFKGQFNIGFYFHSPWPASAIFNTF